MFLARSSLLFLSLLLTEVVAGVYSAVRLGLLFVPLVVLELIRGVPGRDPPAGLAASCFSISAKASSSSFVVLLCFAFFAAGFVDEGCAACCSSLPSWSRSASRSSALRAMALEGLRRVVMKTGAGCNV